MLEPLLDYAEHGGWPKEFAEHDLGTHYPDATGHNDGNEESMPVEESANMLIMAAAAGPAAARRRTATAFATTHYRILRQWAEYLVGNTLDPGFQNQTDDFTGFIAHSANLALKGIIGVGAMGVIAAATGNAADAARYRSVVPQLRQPVGRPSPQDSSGQHLKLAYDQDGTWSLKYNGFADRVLGLDLVPARRRRAGGRLVPGAARARTACCSTRATTTRRPTGSCGPRPGSPTSRTSATTLVEGVYSFANTTPQRVPFTDWYVVADATQRGFQARPVVGGYPGPADAARRPRRRCGGKLQNQHSGKVLAVSGMSLADTAEVTQWRTTAPPTTCGRWSTTATAPSASSTATAARSWPCTTRASTTAPTSSSTRTTAPPTTCWRIVDAGGGWSKIVNVRSGKVMAVDDQSKDDGAQVTQWTDNGTPDHLWRLV